ncbi:MAG: septum formation protein Maf [Candidatus Doudnabacteria bacterium RIFCSPHIGHO2_02_FULL_48_21]|uniref:Nucleoside triphosphate pyrophosphatase n=1 Tax=Candidatus Doudnabacteria bacterium RIFCSPLOWO2_02_FULL_48_13 TaxID=1817845 RepID=A0A1F5QA92_9BACT|nr:MAG: septum formation protein Maf [Candidatus Doudnabacteria bacterium RIFCSPHIGHO2_01_48_18]OGE94079.1 MAG: septum formation protein Maf [Candidatus Doudnabacteria bacterium RIFCSPHIGHO2_02_FULL_48_21]OGE99114.1 MAG: septum formation protein Maf [Candidatus Doudnabacteria bacterium RIFCSPLOWO2_02_FULL_48_13]
MKLILGSASARRKKILEDMGFSFEIITPNIDEKAIRLDDPQRLVLALANAKADAILGKIREPAIIITSDQVVSFNDLILEKPEDAEDAKRMLRSYANASVKPVTSVVVTNTINNQRFSGVDVAAVDFKRFTEDSLDKIIANREVNVLDRAGGFAVEHPLFSPFIERIHGEVESIMGLPKTLTLKLLAKANYD